MKRINKRYIKFIKLIVIPSFLILFWLFSSIFFNEQISFSVIRYSHNIETFKNFNSGVLLKGKKITGEIDAKDNYFGIVSLRFKDFLADYQKEETISFRIKEKSQNDWHSNSDYKIGLLQSRSLFPFGILPIADSKDKKYVFEIESSSTNQGNSIKISNDQPVIFSSYQFPIKEITKSPITIIDFLFKKTINSLTNKDFLLFSIVFLFPLIFYLFFITIVKDFSAKNIIFLIFLNLIYIESVLNRSVMIPIVILIMLGWIILIKKLKLDKGYTLLMSFILTVVWLFLEYFNIGDFSFKISFWVYSFLALGIFQVILENLNEKV